MQHYGSDIERLFRQHYRKMYLVAKTLLGDEEESRDVVSEVFAGVLSKPDAVNHGNAEGYLIASVRYRCLNAISRTKVADRLKRSLAIDTGTGISETDSDIVKRIDREADRLDSMLCYVESELPPPTSRIITMRYRQRMTYGEIARELGISEAAVYKHLAQGVRALRKHFNP